MPPPAADDAAATARLRVALLSPCYWPEVRRGSERFARDLADGLIGRGHRLRLITSHPGRPRCDVEDGLPVTRWWRPPGALLLRRGYSPHLTHVPFSYASLRAGHDDIVDALYPTDALAAARWSARTGKPSVFSLMGMVEPDVLDGRRHGRQLLGQACRGCSAVVALSRAAAESLRRELSVDARVIAPGVDTDAFAPGGGRDRRPTIVCAAAIEEPRKRVELLVEAFARVRRERPDARLVLSRPRSLGATGRALAKRQGVELADLDGRDALARAYRSAWVSALPSRNEAFGLVLAEALACGTPAVGTAEGGIPEVISAPDVGRLVEPGDDEPARLARALLEALELASEPDTARACRTRALELSTDACVDAYEALYRELVGAGHA